MLYLEHFGLDEPPFRITPHTDFFFDGADRGATLEALMYAILHDEGIVKVSGEVGSGKTMLCRVLMERLPEHVEIVYLANPTVAKDEILHAIADDLDVEFSQDRVTIALRELEEHLIDLYADGRRVVVLIDEAHAMPEDTLEQVRLLSNLESSRHKLLQIVLFGQPELDQVLSKSSMRQLKDRITHSFRMRPLTEGEVGKYLSFRMRAAGYRGPELFGARAVSMMTNAASGLTRRVNILADKALLAAFAEDKHAITAKEARKAINDSEFGRLAVQKRHNPHLIGLVTLLVGLVIGAGLQWVPSSIQPEQVVTHRPLVTKVLPVASGGEPPAIPTINSAQTATDANTVPASQIEASPVILGPTAEKAPPASLLGVNAARRIAAYETGKNHLLKSRIEATRHRLDQEPDGSYSIELFATDNSDPARVERFLLRAREVVAIEDLMVIPQGNSGRYRIRVTFGGYSNREAAARAEEALPAKYKQAFRTELRSFAELRESL
jgi:MSHA biogenesis protein MshM